MKFLLRILFNALALWVAATLFPGMQLSNQVIHILLVALVFGVVNALIRPVVRLFSLPITCLTFGLFGIVVNALMLILTSWLVPGSLQFTGAGFSRLLTAILASIVISIVSGVLNLLLHDDKRRKND